MIDLNTERMLSRGDVKIDNFLVNKLYGLNDLCKKYIDQNKILLELGSHRGISTELFCNYAKSVTGVDKIKLVEIENLQKKFNNFNFIHSTWENFFNQNHNKYDIIYIDGVYNDPWVSFAIKNSLKILNNNGIICGHDCHKRCPGVKTAILKFFNEDRIEIFSDSSWAVVLD